jgi:hypothetical protein
MKFGTVDYQMQSAPTDDEDAEVNVTIHVQVNDEDAIVGVLDDAQMPKRDVLAYAVLFASSPYLLAAARKVNATMHVGDGRRHASAVEELRAVLTELDIRLAKL